ncbi:hypothetical protein ACO22_00674 [Paracoccidioides brasiliensis]|uniref:Amidohydrolase-related domain-containing protein n=1 Tax=Paracoccidioides brasiliensis TaxID=121759 RepID=A0A1D2JP41_PARBR|nr:hypothetical protein ACO22_00674 [Paracoccidioides brasiliensis]
MPEVQRLFEQSGADKELLEKRRTPDELVALMDAAGVSQICICAWYRPGHAVFSNSEVAAFTRAYPDRFIGIAGVDLLDPVCAVKELDHYVKKEGFKGLRVVPWLWALPPTDAHYWPLYVKCVELDIPFVRSPRIVDTREDTSMLIQRYSIRKSGTLVPYAPAKLDDQFHSQSLPGAAGYPPISRLPSATPTCYKAFTMSEPIPESIPTSQDPRSKRPLKRRALTPVSEQATLIQTLFKDPTKEVHIPAPSKPRTSATLPPPPEIVANVQGSSAGAGSGEFHVYKASRRREYERLRLMEIELKKEQADEMFERRREEARRKDEEKTEKNRRKREKKKKKAKEKAGASGAAGDVKMGDVERTNSEDGNMVPVVEVAADGNREELGVIIHDED